MTPTSKLNLTGFAIIALGMTSGLAIAGEGHKDCKKNKTTAQATMPSSTAGYMPASTSVAATSERAKTKSKVMTFDEALELCTSKRAENLQACVDKKSGQAKPAS